MTNDIRKKRISIAIIAAVVLIAIVLVLGFAARHNGANPAGSSATAVPLAPKAAYAASGEVISGFPSGMILDPAAKVASSYSLSYNASLSQYTASFDSKESMADLYAAYGSYFQTGGWTVTNRITTYPTSRGIYAMKDATEASVAIITESNGSQVIVSYVVK